MGTKCTERAKSREGPRAQCQFHFNGTNCWVPPDTARERCWLLAAIRLFGGRDDSSRSDHSAARALFHCDAGRIAATCRRSAASSITLYRLELFAEHGDVR